MSKKLKDFSILVKRAEDLGEDIEEALRQAAYQLQSRQFLYQRKGRHRRHYDMILRHQDYYLALMDALDFDMVINEERGYVGVLPRSFARRMSLNSTLLLFTLRYIYDEELIGFNAEDDGCVQVTLEDFEIRCKQFTKRDVAKSAPELKNLLETFIHAGVVEVGPDEEFPEIERIKIYPSITSLLSGDMLQRVEVYMRAEDVDTQSIEAEEGEQEDHGEIA